MESSDDENEIILQEVSNYHFVDGEDEPISFSELPIRWDDKEEFEGKQKQIYLKGSGDNGLQSIYRQVLEWKFNISDEKPEISVLAKGIGWISLDKPRKSYEEIIRTILITLHCLYFVKEDPELSKKSLWDQLSKCLSSYDPVPSEKDLVDHIVLIREAVRRDKTLAKSEILVTFLEGDHQKKKLSEQDVHTMERPEFIVSDDHMEVDDEEESDEDEDLFDSVCSICDNGGEILVCEGRCLRSFHAVENAGLDSSCETLGYSTRQVKAMQKFFCENCQHKQHQCFVCGKLGSSDKKAHAEVFPCVSATCGHFYHPHCVAELLHHGNASEAEKLEKKISAGESFTCPIHKCFVCKLGENKAENDMQFAICRRCPKSYHRKCLPRDITFEDDDDDIGLVQRAWEGLIPSRILIYCLDHEIDEELKTPIRNHLKFPGGWPNKKKQAPEQLPKKVRSVSKDSRTDVSQKKSSASKVQKQTGRSYSVMENESPRTNVKRVGSSDISNKRKVGYLSKPFVKATGLFKANKVSADDNGPSLGDQLYALATRNSEGVRTRKEEIPDQEDRLAMSTEVLTEKTDDMLTLDVDSQNRILALAEDACSAITMKDITKSSKMPQLYAYSSKASVDKGITLGKVEGSIEAIREALQKIEGGSSVEDAKAVCEPQLVNQIVRWKNKLKVYLSPFLYGMRYTSFGRHFTKVEKLKEIVDKVHWYAEEGDTIVDFCCGANDFSLFMKSKMDETKKKCFYKNYDVIQAKNDFCFQRQDWMTVRPKELPKGSKLIMGLNPPFGVNAALANKFINKALEFKPKLIILIVPRETERLDKKNPPYDLIWEDSELLKGMSFYLPGSVDVNDNQMEDWNVNAPPLYLWSRQDWTNRHKKIAEKNGHFYRKSQTTERQHEQDCNVSSNQVPMMINPNNDEVQVRRSRNTSSSSKNDEKGGCASNGNSKNRNSKKRKRKERFKRELADRMEKRSDERRVRERRSEDITSTYSSRKQPMDIPRNNRSGEKTPKDGPSLSSRVSSSSNVDQFGSSSEIPRPREVLNKEQHYHHHHRNDHHRNDQIASGGSSSTANIDDIVERYSREEPYSRITQSWSESRPSYGQRHEMEPLLRIQPHMNTNNTFGHISSSYLSGTGTPPIFGSSIDHRQMGIRGHDYMNNMNYINNMNNTTALLQRYGPPGRIPQESLSLSQFGLAPRPYRPPHFDPNNPPR